MKIVIDRDIPFIEGVLEPYATVVYKDGFEISREDILDADALIIRTRTRCNGELLAGTGIKIIATATIGTDHIDLEYCNEHRIFVQNAAGCNAGGVMDYVFSALYGSASRKSIDLNGATFGIIGVGHVGSRVEEMARRLGFKVLLNDPPREEKEGPDRFCDLDTLLENSDIVSIHTPLNDATRGMAGSDFFSKMKVGAFFINAARGGIVNDDELIEAIPKLGPVIIDTWNHEPDINLKLLNLVDIATPHIAGYSYQGKQFGTMAAVRAIARYFDIKDLFEFFPHNGDEEKNSVTINVKGLSQGQIASVFQYNYPIFTDDFVLRANPECFEQLRSEYQYRREFYIV